MGYKKSEGCNHYLFADTGANRTLPAGSKVALIQKKRCACWHIAQCFMLAVSAGCILFSEIYRF